METSSKQKLAEIITYAADFLAGAAGGFVGGRVGGVYGAALGRSLAQEYIQKGAFLIYYGTTTPYHTASAPTQSKARVTESNFTAALAKEQMLIGKDSYVDYLIASSYS